MLIEIKNLQFRYVGAREGVLDIPELTLNKGEKVFLYGPSGCGKTTLLETLAGVLSPDNGEVKILNTDLSKLSAAAKDTFRADHLGYIFQSFNLIPYLSVLENITLPLHLSSRKRSKVSEKNQNAVALQICVELGIDKLIHRKVTELSVGQQQRVAAARAIIGDPELILADEPTSSLDYDRRERFIKLLFQLCEEHQITLLFVSHDQSLLKLFDRSIHLPEVNLCKTNYEGVL